MKIHLPPSVAHIPTQYGEFSVFVHGMGTDNREHVVLVNKDMEKVDVPLVRIHSECFTGDTLGSLRCDCNEQLHQSLTLIGEQGGIVIYLRQEGRGIGLANKLKAYVLQEQGFDTVEANQELGLPVDSRTYEEAVQILKELGVMRVRLLTNNPDKVKDIEAGGITVTERIPIEILPNAYSKKYLEAKKEKLGHLLGGHEQ